MKSQGHKFNSPPEEGGIHLNNLNLDFLMLEALKELYHPANKQLREDVDGVTFHPPYLSGPHWLVQLETKKRILKFRRPGEEDAFCFIYVALDTPYPAEDLLECPDLQGRLSVEMLRDFRALSWLFLRLGRFEELFHVPARL